MELETQNLSLYPVNDSHVPEIFAHFRGKVLTYMVPSAPKTQNEIAQIVRDWAEQCRQGTDSVFAIIKKLDGEFLGIVGLHNQKNQMPELGVWLKPTAQGHHFGREAVGGVIQYAKSLGVRRLCYPVDIRNTPSKKIALFFGGACNTEPKRFETADGRTLFLAQYEIENG